MSFIRQIFSKKSEEDYETVLSNLANDIQKRQTQLSDIRLRERRSTLVVTLYTLAAWVGYLSLWYMNALPDLKAGRYIRNGGTEKVFKGLPVIMGPIMVLFIRRVVQIWYQRKGDAEEKTLKALMKTRRDKVEEIKKKTNYYSTRELLQKYDESSPSATPRQRPPPGQYPSTPKGRPIPNNGKIILQTPAPSSELQSHLSPMTLSYPVAPPRKQWYDKLADAILGEDDPSFASPSARYALICEKCFNHNGLVKESMWEEAQYVCPKCGHFNASVRAKKSRPRQSLSPTSSPSQSPQSRPQPMASPSSHIANESERDLPTVDGTESTPMEVDPTEVATSSSS